MDVCQHCQVKGTHSYQILGNVTTHVAIALLKETHYTPVAPQHVVHQSIKGPRLTRVVLEGSEKVTGTVEMVEL